MIYLGSLNNIDTLEKIIEIYNPSLIYFICYLGNPDKFKLDSRINDREIDCKKLETLDITTFERPVHTHKGLCDFTPNGKLLFEELRKNEICEEIYNILHKKDENDNVICNDLDTFTTSFNNTFSIDIEPDNVIEMKRRELINNFHINIAPNNHEINIKDNCCIIIEYNIYGEDLGCNFKIRCNCSNEWEEVKEDLKQNLVYYIRYKFICRNCNRIFAIEPNLYNANTYFELHLNENP